MITVIIPAYNCENTIERCVYSLMNQTYKELEIIVVSDGSTDSTEEVVLEICIKDNRVRLITQINSGVSIARNRGIAEAKGEIIGFVDSDDYVEPTFIESLLAMYSPGVLPVVNFSNGVIDEGVLPMKANEKYPIIPEDIDDQFFTGAIGEKIGFCVWNKLFSKEILDKNNILFKKDLQIGEDMVFLYQYICYCHEIHINRTPLYRYIINNDSVTKKDDAKLAVKYEKTFLQMREFEENGIIIREDVLDSWALDVMPYILLNKAIWDMNISQFKDYFSKFINMNIVVAAGGNKKEKSIKKKVVQYAITNKNCIILFMIIKLYSFYKHSDKQ